MLLVHVLASAYVSARTVIDHWGEENRNGNKQYWFYIWGSIDIRPHTRYNIDNLIRKQCYHYRIFSENGSHKYEFAGTEWLNPQGDSVTHLSARGA